MTDRPTAPAQRSAHETQGEAEDARMASRVEARAAPTLEPTHAAAWIAGRDAAIGIIAQRSHELHGVVQRQEAEGKPCIVPAAKLNELDQVLSLVLALQPPGPVSEAITRAAADMLAERRRQIKAEGWSPNHDDEHTKGEIAQAAAAYATSAVDHSIRSSSLIDWPWKRSWWKPTGPRRDLVKAGALILAEIERLDRATSPTAPGAAEEGGE